MTTAYRWGFTFLQTDLRLTEKQRYFLLERATIMYLNDKMQEYCRLTEDGENSLEGRISTKGEYGVLGTFQGVKFSAEVDTNKGKAKLAFLVSEQTGVKAYQRDIDYFN